jgi:hypothetical protein
MKNKEIGWTCGMYGEQEKRIQGFCIGKPEGKRKIGRRKRRWKNIKIYFQEIKWEGVNWVYLTQDRDRCMEFLDQLSVWLSGMILLHAVS